MKVVINSCFGGFSLSDEAVELCLQRGMKLTEFGKNGDYLDQSADFVKSELTSSKYYAIHGHDESFRCNPTVVGVVEELGDKSSGFCADLKIVEIPFSGAEGWHIDSYDGNESIDADHASWS